MFTILCIRRKIKLIVLYYRTVLRYCVLMIDYLLSLILLVILVNCDGIFSCLNVFKF